MYRMIIDTETAGTFGKSLVYDFGGVVMDNHGEIVDGFSFVIDEVFNGMPEKMDTAYYAEKLPAYHMDILNGKREVLTLANARARFVEMLYTYNISEVWAFNMDFDRKALAYTSRLLGLGEFFPSRVITKCVMGAFLSTKANTRRYANFAERSAAGNIRCNAENAYRYISGYEKFAEEHTAKADSEIEAVILWDCLKQRKRMDVEPKSVMAFPAWHEIQKRFA